MFFSPGLFLLCHVVFGLEYSHHAQAKIPFAVGVVGDQLLEVLDLPNVLRGFDLGLLVRLRESIFVHGLKDEDASAIQLEFAAEEFCIFFRLYLVRPCDHCSSDTSTAYKDSRGSSTSQTGWK